NATSLIVEVNGKKKDFEGVIDIDKKMDLAIIKIKGNDLPMVLMDYSEEFPAGQRIYLLNRENVIEGSILRVEELEGGRKFFIIDIPIMNYAGSPIFNNQGRVIGLSTPLVEGINVIIPTVYSLNLIKNVKPSPLAAFEKIDYRTCPEGMLLIGICYYLAGDFAKARTYLERLLVSSPEDVNIAKLGLIYSKLGMDERAVEIYEQVKDKFAYSPEIHYGLGISYIKLRQYEKAITALEKAISLNPNLVDAYYNLGVAYEELREDSKALTAYLKFLELNPEPSTDLYIYTRIGKIYYKMNKPENAIKFLEKAREIRPENFEVNYYLALSYDKLDQFEKASQLYNELIKLNPEGAEAYYGQLVKLYDRAGQYEKAVEAAKQLIIKNPYNPASYYNLGVEYVKLKDYDKAIGVFNQVIALDPNYALAYYNLGIVYFKIGRYESAINIFKQYIKLNPNDPEGYYNLGTCYVALRQFESALPPLERAVKLKPDHALAHYNLGIAYFNLRDRLSAMDEYRILRNLNPRLAQKLYELISR
ncbi:tetratricopeptide repeat protein, partial [Candidatus Aminicenantes bacterium AC-335-G13]|nr:tetratricopeptide repeat protein [Candidatus Aminicenantes bacterium AC-335-G13]